MTTSDPVARLHACRLQLKHSQRLLAEVRKNGCPTGPYERDLGRVLDMVWEAQIVMVKHLNAAIAPHHFWPYVERYARA